MKKLTLLFIMICFQANAFNEASLDNLSDPDLSHLSVTNTNISDFVSFYGDQPDSANRVFTSEDPQSDAVSYWGSGSTPLLDFGIAELAAAGFSYWGATNPTGFGWFAVAGGVGSLAGLPNSILYSASFFALGDYNFRMADDDDLKEEDIFLRNFLAINIIYATFYATTLLFPQYDGGLALYPDTQGNWYLNYSYSF